MTHRSRRTLRGLAAAGAALTLTLGVVAGGQAAPKDNAGAGTPPGLAAPDLESRVKPIITRGQHEFRDLNANGKVDNYENWRLPTHVRVKDLVSAMTRRRLHPR